METMDAASKVTGIDIQFLSNRNKPYPTGGFRPHLHTSATDTNGKAPKKDKKKGKKKNKTDDITLVVDRSGSMGSNTYQYQTGIDGFLKEQRKQPGKGVFTLIQFDDRIDTVFDGVPRKSIGTYRLRPRGMTSLRDAIGAAIKNAEKRQKNNPTDLVVISILTDGGENSSQKFRSDGQLKELVLKKKALGWKFTFVGASERAHRVAIWYGIDAAAASDFQPDKGQETFSAMSKSVTRMQGQSLAGKRVVAEYTGQERMLMGSRK
jgi:uncharacterized protein YegL